MNRTAIRFSLFVTLAGILLAVIAGSILWRIYFSVQGITFLLVASGALALIFWRGYLQHAKIPRMGLDWPVMIVAMAVIGLWVVSPDLRQGGEWVATLLGYFLLLVLAVDAFESWLDRRAFVSGLLIISGMVILLAALETYSRYALWWQQIGSYLMAPPYPYRLISILGHPNTYMAFTNLCAPLAIVTCLRARSRLERTGAVLWLVLFAITVPFTSSRGGWLGLLTWLGLFILLWAWEIRIWTKIKAWLPRSKVVLMIAAVAVMASLAVGGYFFYREFGAHPSHTADFFGSRAPIWQNAVKIWLESPWVGVGAGRFGLEYLRVDASIPPDYWATHAHNIFLQTAAEYGLIGLAIFLYFVVTSASRVLVSYHKADGDQRLWSRALLVAIAAWFIQCMLDDFTGWPVVMVPLILLTAMLITNSPRPLRRWDIQMEILFVPAMILAIIAAAGLFAYRPMVEGLNKARSGNWSDAAASITVSTRRDPNLAYYYTEAGLAWAQAWQTSGDVLHLVESRMMLEHSVQLEDSPALVWANLAMMDWHAGDQNSAINHINMAIQAAPYEPSFYLNRGWILEQMGDPDEASQAYTEVLTNSPQLAGHPYWQQTQLRKQVLAKWSQIHPTPAAAAPTYWAQARAAVASQNYAEAERLLALSSWVGEDGLAAQIIYGLLAERQGDAKAELAAFEAVRSSVDQRIFPSSNFGSVYSRWLYHRDSLGIDLVPGFLQLVPDVGQFDALQTLWGLYARQGKCQEAESVWKSLQRARQGGELAIKHPAPSCPISADQDSSN